MCEASRNEALALPLDSGEGSLMALVCEASRNEALALPLDSSEGSVVALVCEALGNASRNEVLACEAYKH